MPFSKSLSQPVLEALHRIEPGADFTQSGNQVQSKSSNRSYFVKLGTVHETEQYIGEAESLRAMYAACPGICPQLFECSVDEKTQNSIFISEYKKIGSLGRTAAAELGRMLADMHLNGKSPSGKFGFDIPTFCGATRMSNGWFDTWEEAYDQKIGELLERLESRRGYQELCELGKQLREKAIPRLLGSLKIEPVILHGDLWNGNAGTDGDSEKPVIFDPSSYYGHNEMDLSIARMFGGFSPAFFEAYHQKIPPSEPTDEYDTRCTLYEVFHYLNHTVLFGGSYTSMAKQKMSIVMRFVLENKKALAL